MLSIGKYIRVQNLDNTITRKAIISFIHNDNGTQTDYSKIMYDIIYINSQVIESRKEEIEEENNVIAERISLLQDFEYETVTFSSKTIELKNQGNIIFNLKDFQCALEYYKKAIFQLIGMISDEVKHKLLYDVILDDNHPLSIKDDDEIHGVHVDRLVILMTTVDDQINDCLLQRSIYLNIARSYLKLSLKGWAIKYASLAIAVNHYIIHANNQKYDVDSKNALYEKLCADAYYFRAKALLIACRPKYATKDCRQLMRYDATKGRLLQQDIELYKSQVTKSNQKLAKNIAAWINVAMNITSTNTAVVNNSHLSDDLDLLEEEEDSGIIGNNNVNISSEITHVKSIHENSTIKNNAITNFRNPNFINTIIYVILLSAIASYAFNYFVYN